jgi:hypothetical protein
MEEVEEMSETFIINQGLEMRTNASGKTRFTVRVVSEPLVITTDAAFLAMKPAVAMAEFLRQKVAAISAKASPNTLRARHTALAAFVQGKEWAQKRYSGGRIGSIPPLRSEQAFNDSGRFQKSIRASKSKDGSWRIDVAANRLDPTTSHSFERVWNRLVELVPEFGQGIATSVVQEGIAWSMRNMIRKESARSSRLSLAVVREAFKVAENLASLFAA